jgi:hypothetical protein
MSSSGENTPKDKSPRKILEIDLHNSPTMQDARLAAEKGEGLILEIEKHSGVRALRDQLALIEASPALKHAREAASLFEETSTMRAVREQFRQFEQSSVLAQARMFEENSAITRALEAFKSHEELARMAMGPMWELRRAGMFYEDASWRKTAELASQAMASFEARFRLPDHLESVLLAEQFRARAITEKLEFSNEGVAALALQQAMEKMTTPWLDQQEATRSIAGFAEIQRIGEAVRTIPAFDDSLAASLRASIGDWRDPISWRPEVFTDLAVRGDFYVGLGFNPALTRFPLPAFEQGLEIAGLEQIESELEPVDIEEGGLVRTNAAHGQLLRVERALRKFIDQQLTVAFGPDWPKHRLPNGVYDSWQEKKRKAEEAGAEMRPLIEYSDFTDYAPILCRRDNWREVFQAFFRREESVRETFQRLHPVRLDVAHARLITQDDELLLRVEVRRLEKAMGNV